MAVWVVKAGKHGEQEAGSLGNSMSAIGWHELPDLTNIKTRDELYALYERTYPEEKLKARINHVGQVWAFIQRIQPDDLIVLPLRSSPAIAIGRVTGNYTFRNDLAPNLKHTRPVEWIKTDIPTTKVDDDLLYSFRAFMTVCQVTRNNAEQRVRSMVSGVPLAPTAAPDAPDSDERPDIEQIARDQILHHITTRFKGHALSVLVDEVLRAQGFVTKRSDPGPDGGVDILAGRGPLGFDGPRLCVQVKSSDSPADLSVLRHLQGTLKTFGADQGLLVSWGGFNRVVRDDSRREFFNIRLWDAEDLLSAIFDEFEDLPASVQADLPLKRIWALVPEEQDE